jgi:hypothetical protein
VWEVSIREDVVKKLDEDYAKRSADPLGVDPAQTAYIAVTARKWPVARQPVGKKPRQNAAPVYVDPKSWAGSKVGGPWREVRVLDAIALEGWLAQAPAVASWFAREHLGVAASGVAEALRYLQDWQPAAARSEVALARLLCAGREDDVARVQRWASGAPSQLPLRAQTWEEVALFVCAALLQTPWERQAELLGRALVITTPEALRHCTQPDAPRALLIAAFYDAARHVRPTMTHHHLLIPYGSGPEAVGAQPLGAQPANALASVLARWFGQGEREANRLTSEAGRSVMGVLRALDAAPAPAWVSAPDAHKLIPALLVGQWSVATYGEGQPLVYRDVEVFTQFPELRDMERLRGLIAAVFRGEQPLEEVQSWMSRGVLRWRGRDEALRYLLREVPAHESAWQAALDLVFSAPDACYDVAANERLYTPWDTEGPRDFSAELRRGMAEGLRVYATAGGAASRFVERSVQRILDTMDWRRWATLGDVLPIFAEVAPSAFLNALDAVLRVPSRLAPLFEAGEGFGAQHAGGGVVRALALVAWWPEHTQRAARVLAELTQITGAEDPRQQLLGIFHPWMPQTTMGVDERAALLDRLATRWPQLVWSMRREWMRTLDSGRVPEHVRPAVFDAAETRASNGQVRATFARIVAGLLEQAGDDPARWIELLDGLELFWLADQADAVLACLRLRGAVLRHEKAVMWAWRVALNRHFSHQTADGDDASETHFWALVRTLYGELAPSSDVAQRWLFEHHRLEDPDGDLEDWRAEEVRQQHRRDVMLRSLLSCGGLAAVAEFVASLEVADVGGEELAATSLALVTTDAEVSEVLASLEVPPERAEAFWVRFFWPLGSRAEQAGRLMAWFEETVALLNDLEEARREVMVGGLVRRLPIDEGTIAYLSVPGREHLSGLYWRRVPVRIEASVSAATLLGAGRALLGAGRWGELASLLVFRKKALDGWREQARDGFVSLLRDVMDAVRGPEQASGQRNRGFHMLLELHHYVLESGNYESDWLCGWELALLPLLRRSSLSKKLDEDFGSQRGSSYLELFRRLERDPAFFVELLSYWTRGDDAEEEVSEPRRALTSQAYEVFMYWKTRPGRCEGGLMEWVTRALSLAAESGRGEIAASKIGEALANGGAGEDGVWADEEVRAVLEARGEDEVLLRGFSIGIHNRHGSSVRVLGYGGAREQALAAAYGGWAEALEWSAPVTASLLRDVADEFERDAEREDARARFEKMNKRFQLHAMQEGFFTRLQAEAVGLEGLEGLVERGVIERVYDDVYRVKDVQQVLSDSRSEALIPVWLWSGKEGVFWQRTALNLHELSDDSPDQIYIALPLEQQRLGLRPPEGVIVGYRDIEPAERAWFGSVPITRVARTLEDCVALSVDFDDLERAIAVASQGGLITKGEAAALRARMASRMQEAS